MKSYEMKTVVKGKTKIIKFDFEEQTNEQQKESAFLLALKRLHSVEIKQVQKRITDPVKEAEFEISAYIADKELMYSVEGLVDAFQAESKHHKVAKEVAEAIRMKFEYLNILLKDRE